VTCGCSSPSRTQQNGCPPHTIIPLRTKMIACSCWYTIIPGVVSAKANTIDTAATSQHHCHGIHQRVLQEKCCSTHSERAKMSCKLQRTRPLALLAGIHGATPLARCCYCAGLCSQRSIIGYAVDLPRQKKQPCTYLAVPSGWPLLPLLKLRFHETIAAHTPGLPASMACLCMQRGNGLKRFVSIS
jgi:hypothetical protein